MFLVCWMYIVKHNLLFSTFLLSCIVWLLSKWTYQIIRFEFYFYLLDVYCETFFIYCLVVFLSFVCFIYYFVVVYFYDHPYFNILFSLFFFFFFFACFVSIIFFLFVCLFIFVGKDLTRLFLQLNCLNQNWSKEFPI
jgi:hypothetical protein